MKGHYLLIQVTAERGGFERIYWPLEKVDEEPSEALARWLDMEVAKTGRVRGLDKLREQIRATVERYTLCRPSSWHREQAEKDGRPYPSPPGGWRGGRKRNRVAA